MGDTLNNKNSLFLIDGIGAIVSAFMIGVVLIRLQHLIGIPKSVLYNLAIPVYFFALYSMTCHFLNLENWRPFLKGIALANLSYCCITFILLLIYWNELTVLGMLYFLVEIIIVVTLSIKEWKYASRQIS